MNPEPKTQDVDTVLSVFNLVFNLPKLIANENDFLLPRGIYYND